MLCPLPVASEVLWGPCPLLTDSSGSPKSSGETEWPPCPSRGPHQRRPGKFCVAVSGRGRARYQQPRRVNVFPPRITQLPLQTTANLYTSHVFPRAGLDTCLFLETPRWQAPSHKPRKDSPFLPHQPPTDSLVGIYPSLKAALAS